MLSLFVWTRVITFSGFYCKAYNFGSSDHFDGLTFHSWKSVFCLFNQSINYQCESVVLNKDATEPFGTIKSSMCAFTSKTWCIFTSMYYSVFQPFSCRETSQKFLIIWRNLNAPYSTICSIFREPSKELAEPLGSAEPRLKNTDVVARSFDQLFF